MILKFEDSNLDYLFFIWLCPLLQRYFVLKLELYSTKTVNSWPGRLSVYVRGGGLKCQEKKLYKEYENTDVGKFGSICILFLELFSPPK